MKKLIKQILPLADLVISPITLVAALFFRLISKMGMRKLSITRKIFDLIGIYPVRDHYYEPLINAKHLHQPLSTERSLPGIDWNEKGQLDLINSFSFSEELKQFPEQFVSDTTFHYNNGSFESGDAEFLYNIIRAKKPNRIIEIGSGHSTKMARLAIEKNTAQDAGYTCKHICIEPYEMPWLEKLGVEVIRKKVELIEVDFFRQLQANDILFIDSSHMIRPQGDVLFEFLELLPTMHSGVIVHIHDIFSPRDYSEQWIVKENYFWNEQYLLEAFLSCNKDWEIIGALNFLKHKHYDLLSEKCPKLTPTREPGSFYILKK